MMMMMLTWWWMASNMKELESVSASHPFPPFSHISHVTEQMLAFFCFLGGLNVRILIITLTNVYIALVLLGCLLAMATRNKADPIVDMSC